jgi:hypothetical protein
LSIPDEGAIFVESSRIALPCKSGRLSHLRVVSITKRFATRLKDSTIASAFTRSIEIFIEMESFIASERGMINITESTMLNDIVLKIRQRSYHMKLNKTTIAAYY